MKTIAEAKQHLRDSFKTGTVCPCCNKYVKAYVSFVKKQSLLPDHCLVYNGNVYSWSTDLISITEALTESFDYDKMMDV